MRLYEIALILHPQLDEEGVKALSEKVQSWIAAAGGSVEKVDLQGKKRLAYPIRKQHEGYYVLLHAGLAPAAPSELERNMRLTEQIVRFMIVRLDDAVAAPEPAPAEPESVAAAAAPQAPDEPAA